MPKAPDTPASVKGASTGQPTSGNAGSPSVLNGRRPNCSAIQPPLSPWGIGCVEGCAPGVHESANVQEALISSRPAVARFPDAAHELRVSLSTVRRLVKAGRLRTVSLGTRAVGITYAELSRFLAAQA